MLATREKETLTPPHVANLSASLSRLRNIKNIHTPTPPPPPQPPIRSSLHPTPTIHHGRRKENPQVRPGRSSFQLRSKPISLTSSIGQAPHRSTRCAPQKERRRSRRRPKEERSPRRSPDPPGLLGPLLPVQYRPRAALLCPRRHEFLIAYRPTQTAVARVYDGHAICQVYAYNNIVCDG